MTLLLGFVCDSRFCSNPSPSLSNCPLDKFVPNDSNDGADENLATIVVGLLLCLLLLARSHKRRWNLGETIVLEGLRY